jgi:hypothetical protein
MKFQMPRFNYPENPFRCKLLFRVQVMPAMFLPDIPTVRVIPAERYS